MIRGFFHTATYILILLHCLAKPFSLYAQSPIQVNTRQVTQVFDSLNTLIGNSPNLYMVLEISSVSGLAGLKEVDGEKITVAYWKQGKRMYGKSGSQEWIQDDSLQLVVDTVNFLMKLEKLEQPQMLQLRMAANAAAASYPDSAWQAEWRVQKGIKEHRLISRKQTTGEPALPELELSLRIGTNGELPIEYLMVNRELLPVSADWKSTFGNDEKPVIVKTSEKEDSKGGTMIVVQVQRTLYSIKVMQIPGGFAELPVKISDRIVKADNGDWKPAAKFQHFELLTDENF
jgi:hypothetical protein